MNCCRQVCARPSEGEGFAGHCSDGTLLSVCGLMLLLVSFRRCVRLIRTCPVGTTRERTRIGRLRATCAAAPARTTLKHVHRAVWPIQLARSAESGSRFAIKVWLRTGLNATNADNPSWDAPNNRQPCSDTGSELDTRAAWQNRAWPIAAGASAQVGETREPTAPQMGPISAPECHGSQHDYDMPAVRTAETPQSASLTPVKRTNVLRTCGISDARSKRPPPAVESGMAFR